MKGKRWVTSSRQKLIAFLKQQLENKYSGKALRKLLELNLCRVNGRVERFASKEIAAGSVVELAPNWEECLVETKPDIQTIYEDEDLLIINKPNGWICEESQVQKTFGRNRYLVHRLDKTTTGLLILAKSLQVKEALIGLFEKKEVHKSYLAVVDGTFSKKSGVKETFLAKKGSFEGQTIWGSSSRGLVAITHWKVLAEGKKGSLVECKPITGRTHQIRVHMAELGHPILVDRQYAKSFQCKFFATRPFLHAYRLQFVFKDKKIDVTAPIPSDMRDFCKEIEVDLSTF
jgi:RluA family pseudouridine synthase